MNTNEIEATASRGWWQFFTKDTALLAGSVLCGTVAAATTIYAAPVALTGSFALAGVIALNGFLIRQLNQLQETGVELEEEIREFPERELKNSEENMGKFGLMGYMASIGIASSLLGIAGALTSFGAAVTLQVNPQDASAGSSELKIATAIAAGDASLLGFTFLNVLGGRVAKLIDICYQHQKKEDKANSDKEIADLRDQLSKLAPAQIILASEIPVILNRSGATLTPALGTGITSVIQSSAPVGAVTVSTVLASGTPSSTETGSVSVTAGEDNKSLRHRSSLS